MLLGDVACQGCFGGEVRGVAVLPVAFRDAFGEVDGLEVFFEICAGGEGCAADGAAGHEPLAGAGRAGCGYCGEGNLC